MAKRGVLTHRKTRSLARSLGVMLPHALGILEALWHTTATSAPQGDIGKLSNVEIADSMWFEGDPEELIQALIASKWLATDEKHRLLVVGWSEHTDDAVRKTLDRNGLLFADGVAPYRAKIKQTPEEGETKPEKSGDVETCRDKSSHGETNRDVSCLPEPEPVPEPVPEPENPPASQSPQGVTKRTVKPSTIEEVMVYGKEIELPPEECEKFWDHFTSNGWRVGGKTAMRNWHAALRNWRKTWAERIQAQSRAKPPGSSPPGVDPDRRAPKGDGVDYVLRERDGVVMPKDPKDPSKPFDAVGWFRSRNLPITSQWEQYCDDQEDRAA